MKKKIIAFGLSFIIGTILIIIDLNLNIQKQFNIASEIINVPFTVIVAISCFVNGFLLTHEYLERYDKLFPLVFLGVMFSLFIPTSLIGIIQTWKSSLFFISGTISLIFGISIRLMTYRKKIQIITQDQFWEENKHKLDKELP